MSVNASFNNVTLENIKGYKISACFQTELGFEDRFFVYIHESISEQNELKSFDLSNVTAEEGRVRSTLQITDTNHYRDYSFNQIDLVGMKSFVTHKGKNRILIFQYDREYINENAGSFCTLSNNQATNDSKTYNNKTAAAYLFSIDSFSEPLLTFSSSFNRDGKELLQFASKRSKDNSFLELAIKMDKERKDGGIAAKTIRYKGLSSELNKDNLGAIYTDESYGSMLYERLPSLEEIIREDDLKRLVILNYAPFLPIDALNHAQGVVANKNNAYSDSVETASIILNNGAELDKSADII